jgi:hypothetical protein
MEPTLEDSRGSCGVLGGLPQEERSVNSARELFEKLTGFKQPDGSGSSPQQRLIEYCTQVLGAIERMHVDFKQKHDRRDSNLADDDKKNLAKAVSGFANSGGGVLIWGIEDKTMSPKPITDVQHFVTSLLELAPQVTDPIVLDIDGDWIPSDAKSGQEGFGAIFIPESLLPPHRVILNYKDIKNHYYVRSGGSFVVASHTQLEDMFGRRPKPKLALSTKVVIGSQSGSKHQLYVILGIENKGRGSAKAPFLSVEVHPPYQISQYGIDGNMRFGLRELTGSIRSEARKYGSSADVVIHPGIVHDVTAVEVEIDVTRPPSQVFNLVVDYQIAAEGIKLVEDREIIQGSQLWANLERQS